MKERSKRGREIQSERGGKIESTDNDGRRKETERKGERRIDGLKVIEGNGKGRRNEKTKTNKLRRH